MARSPLIIRDAEKPLVKDPSPLNLFPAYLERPIAPFEGPAKQKARANG